MMKVVTKPFSVQTGEYQSLLFSLTFRRRKWLYIALVIIGIALIALDEVVMGAISMAYGLLVPIMYAFYFQRFANAPANRMIFTRRIMIFEDQFIRAEMDDENKSTINWNSVVRFKETKHHYLFYTSKSQFVVVPRTVFYTPQDDLKLREFIFNRGLLVRV